ncbi:hypothetical protein LX36DRAFT_173766 [Colletotrichum falcatum]|nr:hypothetical protein LX36DRAFT_173766 [Colletotrichum falcatum]
MVCGLLSRSGHLRSAAHQACLGAPSIDMSFPSHLEMGSKWGMAAASGRNSCYAQLSVSKLAIKSPLLVWLLLRSWVESRRSNPSHKASTYMVLVVYFVHQVRRCFVLRFFLFLKDPFWRSYPAQGGVPGPFSHPTRVCRASHKARISSAQQHTLMRPQPLADEERRKC